MAQINQIVPKYSFPYVETHINDYTTVVDEPQTFIDEDVARYIFPFVSSKGVDNRFIRKRTRAEIVDAFGETDFRKYGQPLMQALHVAEAANSEIWCMRVMPDDATYAHNTISAYYKADTVEEVKKASNRKFRIKYVQRPLKKDDKNSDIIPQVVSVKDDLLSKRSDWDGVVNTDGVYVDGEGYTQIPGVVVLYSGGRGNYGNNYRVRVSRDLYYEKDYGIKYYDFEVISTENGLKKEATFVGGTVTSTKYNHATLITDVVEDLDDGVAPVFVNVDEYGVEDLYNAYKDWAQDLAPVLAAELEALGEVTKITADMTDEQKAEAEAKNKEIERVTLLLAEATNIPTLDEFDIFFGEHVATNDTNPLIEFPQALPADVVLEDVGEGENYNEDVYVTNAKYTTTEGLVSWGSVTGVKLNHGDDGTPFDTMIQEELPTGKKVDKYTVLTECYMKAFDGTYDKRILTPKRIKASAIWDANYPMEVKHTMADLAILRNDSLCYLDCGIMSSFSTFELKKLISDYSVFADYKISKNVHHYQVKEDTTKKRVTVTISYFLARQYADHLINYGSHVPFVKSYAQLTGHVRDSLSPSVEDFELDLKETLTDNRFNFFETIDDNVYQRATQNTAQMALSDLLEENNVATLYEMKRIVEADITDRLYDFSDAETRQRFRNFEVAKFANWNGREVESFDIEFRMNQWEAERSILHAYIVVVFRGLQKRAILEIDVNKRPVISETEE